MVIYLSLALLIFTKFNLTIMAIIATKIIGTPFAHSMILNAFIIDSIDL